MTPPRKYYKNSNNQWKEIETQWYQKNDNPVHIRREYVKKDDQWRLVFENISRFNYGYICGGLYDLSNFFPTVDRFAFPLGAGQQTTHVANLSIDRGWSASNNSTVAGYIYGGHSGQDYLDSTDKFEFAIDEPHMKISGNLTTTKRQLCAINDSVYGYVCAGRRATSDYSTIERHTFPFEDGDTMNHTADLNIARRSPSGTNSTSYGYVIAGQCSDGTHRSSVERFEFGIDLGQVTMVGELKQSMRDMSACNSTLYSYIFGGRYRSGSDEFTFSFIQRFEFPFDSGSSITGGNLNEMKINTAANNSTQFGYICGGEDDVNDNVLSTIDRINFSLVDGDASVVSQLSEPRHNLVATDSTDFLNQFVSSTAWE